MKQKLLLHSCCAPCFGYVYELLGSEYDITPYFFNPNIAPKKEYELRFNELDNYCKKLDVTMLSGDYLIKEWTACVKDKRFLGEKSERCWACYEYRLRDTFRTAKQRSFDLVTTTLSISPHKNAEKINEIGIRLSKDFHIDFLEADFKKNDGFRKSLEISSKEGFYRQNYCGCIYSKLERDKKSLWYQVVNNKKTEG